MKALASFTRAPVAVRALALEAAFFLVLARLLVRHVAMRRWSRHLDTSEAPGRKARTVPMRVPRQVARVVSSVARHRPFRAVCLPQAMTVQWMLRRRGIPSRLCFGVRRGDEENGAASGLEFHAWLTVGGRCVAGGGEVETYAPLPPFGASPDGLPARSGHAAGPDVGRGHELRRGVRSLPHPDDGAAPSERPPASFSGADSLGHAFVAYAPRKVVLALLLLLIAGVTEMFGLVMLVPFLHVVGLAGQAGEPSPVTATIAQAATAVGVELTLPAVLGVFVALAVLRAAVAWQRNVLLAGMRLGFVDRFRESLHAAVAGAKWEFLLGRRQSDIQHVLTSDVNRIGQGAFLMLQLTVTAVLALAQILLAVLLSPVLALSAALIGVLLLLATRPLVRRSRTLGEDLTGGNRTLYAVVTDFLSGLKLARIHGAEAPHLQRFAEATETMRQRQIAFASASATARAALGVGAAVALAALVWAGVSTSAATPAELLVMALIFARVLPGLSGLQQYAQQLAHVLPAWTHAQAFLGALKAAAEAPDGEKDVSGEAAAQARAGVAGEASPMRLRDRLAVRNVSFVYESANGEAALARADLEIPAGRMTAIGGASGAGKSTLADILLGLIEPRSGQVLVDGAPLDVTALRRWRRSVACVPQDPYLFHDSIRANLRWARPRASEADMWRALGLASAAEFVGALPEGLDTVVGDRGTRLSGGERQRIALARALIREPTLLVLDEATSQLDAGNERRIVSALRLLRGRTTIVALGHSPAVLEGADRTIVLESGKIVATRTEAERPVDRPPSP